MHRGDPLLPTLPEPCHAIPPSPPLLGFVQRMQARDLEGQILGSGQRKHTRFEPPCPGASSTLSMYWMGLPWLSVLAPSVGFAAIAPVPSVFPDGDTSVSGASVTVMSKAKRPE